LATPSSHAPAVMIKKRKQGDCHKPAKSNFDSLVWHHPISVDLVPPITITPFHPFARTHLHWTNPKHALAHDGLPVELKRVLRANLCFCAPSFFEVVKVLSVVTGTRYRLL
jgi:hypothetical protein